MLSPVDSEGADIPAQPEREFRARSKRRSERSSRRSGSTSAPRSEPPGVVAIDKPAGCTSHDVVARVRRLLDGAKVGHAGTLDPDAVGVLVLCLGQATKISSFLMEADKVYEGRARLGVVTDTQDASGEVLEESEVTADESAVREAAAAFLGPIEQIPPMYSAVKVGGQKLYRLARRGETIEREPRPVTVYEFEITSLALPTFDFRVRCSKGTYVRTLVHDLGAKLGCGGHLQCLARAEQAGFTRDRALGWEVFEEADAAERIRKAALSPEAALEFLPEITLPAQVGELRTNTRILPELLPEGEAGLVRAVVEGTGRAVVGRREAEGLHVLWKYPERSFGRGRRSS